MAHWPTAAAACFIRSSRGRSFSPSLVVPTPMAPEDTQHDLVAHALQVGQRAGQTLHIVQIQPSGVVGEGGSAHFHHNSEALCLCFHVHSP